MCRAVSEGGRRCVGTRKQFDQKVKTLTEKIDKHKESMDILQRRIQDTTLSSDKIADAKIKFITENEMMRKWENHLEELKSHWDQTDEGLAGLRAEIDKSLAGSPEYTLIHARLEEAEKARADTLKRKRKHNTRRNNLDNVMKGEGYSPEQINEMLALLDEAYGFETTPSAKTLKERLDKAQGTWESMREGGKLYGEYQGKWRSIAAAKNLTPEERIERIEKAKAEFKVQKNVAELNYKNARALHDTTAAGRKELKKKIENAEKEDRLNAVSVLRGRLKSAEKSYELIRNSDNARGRLKRRLMSMAEARGYDNNTKVWEAIRNINPVDHNGNVIHLPDPSERREHITLNLTAKDYSHIRSDYEKTDAYRTAASKEEKDHGFRKYVSERLSTTDYKAYHTAPSVVEANRKTRTGSTPNHGRNTTDVSGARRDIRVRVSMTQKQVQNLKALSSHLENTPASIARRLALGGREDLFALQNDRKNDSHWKKMTAGAQEYLGEKVTENYR